MLPNNNNSYHLWGTFDVPGIELNALLALFYLILMITLLIGTHCFSSQKTGFWIHHDLVDKPMHFPFICFLNEGDTSFIFSFDT